MNLQLLWVLCPLIFLAGLIDSIAGGGGLISVTAYVACGLPPRQTLGNNKFSSTAGTFVATVRYIRNGDVDWHVAPLAVACSIAGSLFGSHIALAYSDVYLKYLLLVVVPVIAILTLLKPDFGKGKEVSHPVFASALISVVIGTYDGFFGPGTGMFLTWALSLFAGLDLIHAVGTTKIVNLASNIGALATFIAGGVIDYRIGFPCALSSILGGYVGSGLAVRGGAKVIRPMLVVVLVLLFVKILFDLFAPV